MKSICDEKSKQRIGLVGPKNGGKSSIINSIVSLFLREHKAAINIEENDKVRRATLDVPIPNTNVTLVEFYGASDQSETYLTDVRNFIHGIIPVDAALSDTCQSTSS
jgi:GTPase SAR1 family protein